MFKFQYFIALFFLVGCFQETAEQLDANAAPITALEIPSQTVEESALRYDNKNSIWTLNGSPFSGYAQSLFPDGSLQSQFGLLNGKQQQAAKEWFGDGRLKSVANYHQGKLHGEKKTWFANAQHVLSAELNFDNGKPHGVQKKWYATGEVFKILQFNKGREEGLQQAYRKNGALFANYEAKNGRNYGLKRASLCFEVKEKEIQYD